MINKMLRFEFNRFLMAGVCNNIFMYVIYLTGLLFLPYLLSYTISIGIGTLVSYYLNSSFVFKSAFSLQKAFLFIIFYIVQYLLGVSLLYLLVEIVGMYKAIAPFVVIGFMVPITFLFNKNIIQGQKSFKIA